MAGFMGSPEGDETKSLLEKVQTKDDFHTKRWRCLSHPTRALETLSPVAILEIGILNARDLAERESGYWRSADTTADSFVQVVLDDQELEKCITPVARAKKQPMWLYHCEVDILAPMSMIRLQVFDDQPTEKVQIGFVDICVGDIPHDKTIEGWFELRFQDNFQSTSMDRYNHHCLMREEEVSQREFREEQSKKEKGNQPTNPEALEEGNKVTEKLVVKKQFFASSKERAVDAFQACVHSTADRAEEYGFQTLSASLKEGGTRERYRSNNGELYISLKLKTVVSSADSLFALALDAPPPVNMGIRETTELKRTPDIQQCVDEAWEVKVKLLDDALLCCMYGFKYLISWRCWPLSLLYFLGLLVCCYKSYWWWAIIPALLSVSLVVNSFPEQRKYMTRGGQNADLTEEGFKHTASWRNTDEVQKFILRLLTEDMKARLDNPRNSHKLRAFAAQCMRDGVPTVSLSELRLALMAAPFVVAEDNVATFQRNDLVWVDGRERGTILELTAPENITVELQPTLLDPEKHVKVVHQRQLTKRGESIPNLPKWASDLAVSSAMVQIYPPLEGIRHGLLPVIATVTDILTWKNKSVAVGLLVVLLSVSALFFWAAIMHVIHSNGKGNLSYAQEVVILVLRSLDNFIAAIVTMVIFLFQAWWMTHFSSFAKIMQRRGHQRQAPGIWKFYREDQEQSEMLRNVLAKEAEEYPHGMFHLPHMSGDASVTGEPLKSGAPLGLEALPDPIGLLRLNRGVPDCVRAAARSDEFCTVVQEPGAATAWVPRRVFSKELVQSEGAEEVVPGQSWCALRLEPRSRSSVSLAALFQTLSAASLRARLLSAGPEVILIPEADLSTAVALLVQDGHALWPSTRISSPVWRDVSASDPVAKELAGVWSLVQREQPLGTTVAEYTDGDGPLRLQAPSGLFVELCIPRKKGHDTEEASFGGYCHVEANGRHLQYMQQRRIDFQPPHVEVPSFVVTPSEASIEVTAVGANEFRELWARVGAAGTPESPEVASLELQSESPKGKVARYGLWIFIGMRFARILGPSQGHGTVASAYCQSLAQLRQIRGKSVVDKELNDLYEAVFGVVEEPGRLRTCKKSRSPGQADTMLFDYTDPDTGKVNVESETVVYETPGGRTETWRIVDWTFDPFSRASSPAPSRATSLAPDSEEEPAATSIAEEDDEEEGMAVTAQAHEPDPERELTDIGEPSDEEPEPVVEEKPERKKKAKLKGREDAEVKRPEKAKKKGKKQKDADDEEDDVAQKEVNEEEEDEEEDEEAAAKKKKKKKKKKHKEKKHKQKESQCDEEEGSGGECEEEALEELATPAKKSKTHKARNALAQEDEEEEAPEDPESEAPCADEPSDEDEGALMAELHAMRLRARQ
ncbi:unnamed protein product, partial [Symbiodinium microadriaticum]